MPFYPKISTLPYTSVIAESDDTRNNTTTLADDAELTITVVPGTYIVDALIYFQSTSPTDSSAKVAWSTPASTTGNWTMAALSSTATATTATVCLQRYTWGGTSNGVSVIDNNPITCIVHGRLVVANAGNLTLRWAQQSAVAIDTKRLANSEIRLVQVA